MRLRAQAVYATSMSVHVRCERPRHATAQSGWRVGDERWAKVAETQDTAVLLHTLDALWHSGLQQLVRPKAVGVQLHGLVPAAQHTPDLFEASWAASAATPTGVAHDATHTPVHPERDRAKLLRAVDTLNRKHGKNTVYFASAQDGLDHAPMRIAFNRIPDVGSER